MTDSGRMCGNCVFWRARGGDGDGPARGRCRARLLEFSGPGQAVMTQSDFVCGQWCGRTGLPDAAE